MLSDYLPFLTQFFHESMASFLDFNFPILPSACLQVSPDRSQFFRYDSIALSCEDPLNSTGWKVKRRTSDSGVRPCSSGWGFTSSASTCTIANTYPTDTGVYWCESDGGKRTHEVNITITGTVDPCCWHINFGLFGLG